MQKQSQRKTCSEVLQATRVHRANSASATLLQTLQAVRTSRTTVLA